MSHRVPTPTRADVLGAIARCDELGVDRFLAAYGYQPSRRYVLRHAGKSYPSKAILGVASGLRAAEFSGGAAHTCRVLGSLGFTVRTGAPRSIDPVARKLALSIEFDYAPPAAPELPIEPVAYFASGCNRAGEARAFADLGHDVGICALGRCLETEFAAPNWRRDTRLRGSDPRLTILVARTVPRNVRIAVVTSSARGRRSCARDDAAYQHIIAALSVELAKDALREVREVRLLVAPRSGRPGGHGEPIEVWFREHEAEMFTLVGARRLAAALVAAAERNADGPGAHRFTMACVDRCDQTRATALSIVREPDPVAAILGRALERWTATQDREQLTRELVHVLHALTLDAPIEVH